MAIEHKPMDLSGYMTISQAAKYKGCTGQGIRMRIRRGTMPYLRLGNTMLVRKAELDAWDLNETMQEKQKENWRVRKGFVEKLDKATAATEVAASVEDTEPEPEPAVSRRSSPFD